MAKLHDEWTVFPHGPVQQIDDGLLSVEGEIRMPLGRFPRRMMVVALSDGRTVVFSPICLDAPAMRRIEELGPPAFMVVPNGFHRLDARPWKKRYPAIQVICPPGAKARVQQAVAVDAISDVVADPNVDFIMAEGTRKMEAALIVRRGKRTTLVLNDLISNVRHPKGIGANIMARLFGFGVNGPRMAREVRWFLVKDKPALARQLRAWADDPRLERIVVSHGDIIVDRPGEVLRTVALTLGGHREADRH
jgi:hypothetical protein